MLRVRRRRWVRDWGLVLTFNDTMFKTHCSDKQEETIDEPMLSTRILSPWFRGNAYYEANHQILSRPS
jgi:hypothetical protein